MLKIEVEGDISAVLKEDIVDETISNVVDK
jgi:hypothetical protein